MDATPAAAVTGIGMVTPAGLDTHDTWAALCAGTPTATADPRLTGLPVTLACPVTGFDPRTHRPRRTPQRLDPFALFALAAAREAVADAGLTPGEWSAPRVAVVLGSSCGGVTSYEQHHRRHLARPARPSPMLLPLSMHNMAAAQIAIELDAQGPCLHTSTACASGATAIGTALHMLRAGLCDIALAGGAEAMITPLTLGSLDAAGALSRATAPHRAARPFDVDRDGFVMGEGAAVLVLEREVDARRRGRRPYALVAGYGASCDAHDPVAPHPRGRGATQAIRAALADAGLSPEDIDHVNAHGTATVHGDRVEATVLSRLMRPRTPVTSLKGTIGHLVGAAGAVEAACTALTVHHQLIPPTAALSTPDPALTLPLVHGRARRHRIRAALSNSFGFGGQNAVLAFCPAHLEEGNP
ncbi:beta-ketoacyl-[acyl-carrier-protein] synthase family protein [Streptomyces sp. NPDC058657]|uniref:beta-ketoacyl-[acyl-carrier-protein] synthase family protein n=1 Tax=unclassified Streptomyces TaxID=2593676 RepID=UPI00365BE996